MTMSENLQPNESAAQSANEASVMTADVSAQNPAADNVIAENEPVITDSADAAAVNPDDSPLIKSKKKNFLKKNRFVFFSFIVPMLLMSYAFYCSDFYPFGDNQIMVIDMWHQFFQFFKLLHEKLQSFGSMLYTWNGGLGTNFIAMISYYAASPLNLLSIFVPTKYLTEALAALVVLKISLSGAFMCIYLRSMFKRCDFGTASFSILYALSAFAMGYYWCVMWLDVMALLPLCLLGMNRLIDKGKFKLYVISLALMLISNYYIAIMMCMFIVIYYPVVYFSRLKPRGAKYFATVTGKMAFFSALAACIAAVILIPTYYSMQNTYYIKPSFPTTDSFYNPILDVVSNLLPNVALTVRGGLPNIYCGLISFMLAVLFLLCKKIPARQKILNCSILAFLILSFNWNKLDYIWHCLHFPNELPYRYSFVFTFVLITMAYMAYLHLDDITPAQIGGVTAGGFIYLIVAQKLYADKFDYKVIYIALALLAAYAVVLAIHKTGNFKQVVTGVLLFVVVFGEMTNYTISSVKTVGCSGRTAFYGDYDNVTGLIDQIEKEDTGFYRMELAQKWTTNDPALYGYRGVSQFSSEINAKVTSLMKNIGLAGDPASNSFGYTLSTPVINSMLNLKYIIGKNRTVDDFTLGEPIKTKGNSSLYQNKYPLSIGYMTNEDVADNWTDQLPNPFDVQNQYIWNATGIATPVFTSIDDQITGKPAYNVKISSSGVTSGQYSRGIVSVTPPSAQTTTGSVTITYTSPIDQPLYAYVKASNASSITSVTSSGNTVNFEANRGSTNSVGSVKKGGTVSITINYEAGKAGDITCYVYGLDVDTWKNAYAELSDEMLNVTSFSDTSIKGKITAKEDGLFMTSIPYEKGWTLKVDGKKTDIVPISDALIACKLSEGEHEISLTYAPYGFWPAVTLSVFSIAALFALDYAFKRLRKNNPDSFLVAVPDDNGMLTDEYIEQTKQLDEFGLLIESDDEEDSAADDIEEGEQQEYEVPEMFVTDNPSDTESTQDIGDNNENADADSDVDSSHDDDTII